jgi:hypothetical protein
MEISKLEKELVLLAPSPIYIKQPKHTVKVNKFLAKQISKTLMKIKGRLESELDEVGNLETDEYIQYRINKKCKTIQSFKFFEDEIESQGLDIVCLIDCSGSMRGVQTQIRNITATIIKALEKCSFVNFKVLAFSGDQGSYQGYIDEIKTVEDAGRIQANDSCTCDVCTKGGAHYHDIHNLAIDEACKILKASDSHKKLILMITDGYPEIIHKGTSVPSDIKTNLFKKSIQQCHNNKIETFALFYTHISRTIPIMREIFKGNLYQTEDFADVETNFIKKLIKSVEKMNE